MTKKRKKTQKIMRESAGSNAHPAVGDFQWKRIASPRLTASQLADKGSRSIRRLREWGVDVHNDCRLVRAVELIKSGATDGDRARELGHAGREKLGEAARTLFELYLATHATKSTPPNVVLEKFEDAIYGADLHTDEEAHSARDTQFELYVWGWLNATGAPCLFAEPPDLICKYREENVGIAVKRIWSLDQAKKRLSKAASQIAESKLRGFIAINAQEYLSAGAGVSDLVEKGNAFNRDLNRLHGHLPYLASKRHVLGVLIAGATYRWDVPPDGPVSFGVSVYQQDLFMGDPEVDDKLALNFSAARQAGLLDWFVHNL